MYTFAGITIPLLDFKESKAAMGVATPRFTQ
jgi:hypothetical protein